jgi:hypothetical protein
VGFNRHVRSTICNFERASDANPLASLALVEDKKGTVTRFGFGGAYSYWYQRFAQGCCSRTGQDVRQDLALNTPLWNRVLKMCKKRMRRTQDFTICHSWTTTGSYLAVAYALSIRGPEGFMLEIASLRKHRPIHNGLVWIPIVGKLKGDADRRTHFLRSVPMTDSGVDVQAWRDRMLAVNRHAGNDAGPAICDVKGFLRSTASINEDFWEALEEVYDEDPAIFPKAIETRDDIRDKIRVNRSPCRSSESQATSHKRQGRGLTRMTRRLSTDGQRRRERKGKRRLSPCDSPTPIKNCLTTVSVATPR